MAGTGGKGEGEKLHRLPPGRHGLSREFVAQNQQERLIAGTIAAVAEHGYRETTVTQIAAAAGVSRRTFYAYFKTKDECFAATFDLLEEHLFAAIEEDHAGRSWAAQVRGRVAAMLAVFGANPDLVRFALVAPPAAGDGVVIERHRLLLERIVAAITAGAPEGRGFSAATGVEREAMAGSVAAVLAARVEEGKGKDLEGAFPAIVELVLVPFIGRRKAAAEAQKS